MSRFFLKSITFFLFSYINLVNAQINTGAPSGAVSCGNFGGGGDGSLLELCEGQDNNFGYYCFVGSIDGDPSWFRCPRSLNPNICAPQQYMAGACTGTVPPNNCTAGQMPNASGGCQPSCPAGVLQFINGNTGQSQCGGNPLNIIQSGTQCGPQTGVNNGSTIVICPPSGAANYIPPSTQGGSGNPNNTQPPNTSLTSGSTATGNTTTTTPATVSTNANGSTSTSQTTVTNNTSTNTTTTTSTTIVQHENGTRSLETTSIEVDDVTGDVVNIEGSTKFLNESFTTDGEGTVSGGNDCLSSPACSGDAIQCAQLIQIWEVRCSQEGSGTVSGSIDECLIPFTCDGDALLCSDLNFKHNSHCSNKLLSDDYASNSQMEFDNLIENIGEPPLNDDGTLVVTENEIDVSTYVDFNSIASATSPLGSGTCPSNLTFNIPLSNQVVEFPINGVCQISPLLRLVLILISSLVAARNLYLVTVGL